MRAVAAASMLIVLAGCATASETGRAGASHEDMMDPCPAMAGHHVRQHGDGDGEAARHCLTTVRGHHDGGGQEPSQASSDRLEQVARAGAQVMPFDLERTSHAFVDRPWGGEQIVASDDGDAQQVALIRSHLSQEAARFTRGEFASPERIHGRDMPGLAVLRERYAAMEVRYADTPAGASITYRAQDRAVVEAIHAWFEAQRTDHGAHAEP